jgi:two-component system chemotaxis response regulator CheY
MPAGDRVLLADRTVLVADDVPLIRKLCSAILRKQGYGIIEAQDGREAVAQYQEHRPDVVLLDLRMPQMDGLAALRAIRELDPNARIIIITSGSESEVQQALRAGARGFVLKPFNRDHILAAVQTLFAAPRGAQCAMHGWTSASYDLPRLAHA